MPWRKGKKKRFVRSPILVLYYPHPRKSKNGQTQPSRPTMSFTYPYYGVGLLQSETSAGTNLGALVITSNIKWAGGQSNSSSQFKFISITQGPRIITVGHMWTLKDGEGI